MEHQLLRTPTKATTCTQDLAAHTYQQQPVQDASSKQQTKVQTQLSVDRVTILHSSAHQRKKEKLTSSHQSASTSHTLHEAYTNHCTKLMRAESKRNKAFYLEVWEKEMSNSKSLKMKRQRNTAQLKDQPRNTSPNT